MGDCSSSQMKWQWSSGRGGTLMRQSLYLVVFQTLLLSLLCQRHLVEGCSVNLRRLCPIIPEDETQEPSVFTAFEVVDCGAAQLLINIVGSEGRSNFISTTAIPDVMQYEEFISWEQLPDTRGSYIISVQAFGVDGNSSQAASAKVVINYVYGCQKRFGSSSPERCDIFCQFACETPQLELYSLTVPDLNGREQSVILGIGRPTRIPCQLEVITIEAQGLDGNENELRLPSVITGETQPTLSTGSTDTDSTSTSTTSTTSETEGSASTTMSSNSESESASTQGVAAEPGIETLVIIILASVLGGMVILFLLAAIIVCLWVVMKQRVPICKSGREDTANPSRVLQPPPIQNDYYDSISYNNSRSTSAVYDTVRRGDGPEIFITSSQGTFVNANENNSLRPLQGSSNTNYEPPYDTTIQATGLQAPKEGDLPPDTRVPSPYYSYANNESKVELVQQKDGETGWLTVVGRGRKGIKSWTGSDHVYI